MLTTLWQVGEYLQLSCFINFIGFLDGSESSSKPRKGGSLTCKLYSKEGVWNTYHSFWILLCKARWIRSYYIVVSGGLWNSYTANVYGGLRGVCRFSLQYLWKRAVRITQKPCTPQREEYRVSLFSIDITGKTYRHPVNPRPVNICNVCIFNV